MDLRAPLPPEHCPNLSDDSNIYGSRMGGSTASSSTSKSASKPELTPSKFRSLYETLTHHLLCRMYIASYAMELGSDSRFTGIILFHRYARHFYVSALLPQKQKHQQLQITELDGKEISKDITQLQQQQHEQHQHLIQEMKQIKRHLGQIAAACIFLGCKMEEEPRRIRDVINLSHLLDFSGWDDESLKQPAERAIFKETSELSSHAPTTTAATSSIMTIVEFAQPPPLDEAYWTTKESMVTTEQQVLRMIKFDALVCHPHRCVLVVMDTLGFGTGIGSRGKNGDDNDDTDGNYAENGACHDSLLRPDQSERVIEGAFKILNEASLDATGVALEYPVIVLACAAIALAADGWGDNVMSEVENVHNGVEYSSSNEHGKNNEISDVKSSSKVEEEDAHNSSKDNCILPKNWWRALDVSTKEIVSTKDALLKIIQ